MYLSFGGYNHDDNEVWFNIQKRAIFGPRGIREKEFQRWDIFGVKTGTDEADLTAKMQALENAYSTNGQDLKFWGNGGAMTRHQIISNNTIHGTKVHQFNWLKGNPGVWGSGTEYVNKRSYHIVVIAESVWSEGELYFYRSTVSVTGTGGPRKLWMPSLIGLPQSQTVQAFTTQKIVQTGMNIGLTDHIPADGPLFSPLYEHLDRRTISQDDPREFGLNVNLKYTTRWAYFFEAPTALL